MTDARVETVVVASMIVLRELTVEAGQGATVDIELESVAPEKP
jgi:hypothetical protein